jgi:predicted alpha/beta superfamily hydrolase
MVRNNVLGTALDHGPRPEPWEYIPPAETHMLRSRYVAQTYKIQVMQPAQTRGELTHFPVVYVTDGNFAFDVLSGIALSMQLAGPNAPRFIVVGIGYPGDSPRAGARLRTRDLTFPRYPQLSTEPLLMEDVLLAEKGTKEFCGGEDFQQFIEHELITFIDAKYSTVAGERTYFGHSSGGGFGLFTMLTKAHLFSRYIVSSPGLSYHGVTTAGVRYDHYEFVLEQARAFVAAGTPLRGTRLYMSVGSEEEYEPQYVDWQLTSSFYRLTAFLKAAAIPGLELMTQVFPGAIHMAAWPMAFINGVQAVFGTGSWARSETRAARL